MSQDKGTLPSTAGRERAILEHLKKIGFNMGENPSFIKPAKKRTWSFNRATKGREIQGATQEPCATTDKKPSNNPQDPLAPMQSVKGMYKAPVYQGLIRLPDGSYEVPLEWKTSQKNKDTRRQIVAAKNKLHRVIEALETRHKNKYKELINAHKKTCQELLLCLS